MDFTFDYDYMITDLHRSLVCSASSANKGNITLHLVTDLSDKVNWFELEINVSGVGEPATLEFAHFDEALHEFNESTELLK